MYGGLVFELVSKDREEETLAMMSFLERRSLPQRCHGARRRRRPPRNKKASLLRAGDPKHLPWAPL
eukprot:SAG11_NODE_34698_length_270_cov_1.192982_1_plen_65_part_01